MRSAYRRPRSRRPTRRGSSNRWLGWLAAALGVGVIAFIVGRAGLDVGLAGGTPIPTDRTSDQVVFGSAIDPATGEASGGTNRFRAGDPMAYSVRLAAGTSNATLYVGIVRVDGSVETVVQEPTQTKPKTVGSAVGFTASAGSLLSIWGPGTFVLRVYADPTAAALASGRFILVETPGAS